MKVFQNFPFHESDDRISLTPLSARHIITPRRAGITIASAFACVGIASAMSTGAATGSNDTSSANQDHTVQLKLEKKDSSNSSTQADIDAMPPPAPEKHTESSISLQQSTTSQGGVAPTTTHKVTVNGKEVPVPKNGTVKKVITDKGGSTSVHIISNTNGSTNNSSSSNISVNVSSHSSSSTSNNSDSNP